MTDSASVRKFPINHDLHCHSGLSFCSSDPSFSAADILNHAVESGYGMVAITNHVWDADVPDVPTPEFYARQNIAHIQKALPLPEAPGVQFLFGCETEYRGHGKLGLHPSHYDLFDIIIVPVNHWNVNQVCTPEQQNCRDWFCLQLESLESLLTLDLPWKRVGLAHLQWYDVARSQLPDILELGKRYEAVFREYARRGAGIELNAATILYTAMDDPEVRHRYEALDGEGKKGKCTDYDKLLWFFSLAKKAGCRFYVASDAHTSARLDWPKKYLRKICDDLGLVETDQFIPERCDFNEKRASS